MSRGTRGCLGNAGGRNIRLVCYVGSVQAVLASRTLLFADNRRAARSDAYCSNSSVAWRKSSSMASRSLWTAFTGEVSLTGVFLGASDLCGGFT